MSQGGFLLNANLPMNKPLPARKVEAITKKLEHDDPGATRKEKAIDWNLAMYLCSIQCTAEEIAPALRVSVTTMKHRVIVDGHAGSWGEFYTMYRADGKRSLRRAQWNKAVYEQNTAMLIWLGKQFLNQSERTHVVNQDFDDNAGTKYDLDNISNEELDTMENILTKYQLPEEDE